MICCVSQPLKKYGVVVNEGKFGLVHSYGAPLFSLITRCSRVPFMWEQDSKVPIMERLGTIEGVGAFILALQQKGLKSQLEKDPREFWGWVAKHGCPALEEYWEGKEALQFIIQARQYQFEKWNGRISPLKLDEVKEAVLDAANIYKN
jgi:hypothetical protein